MSLFQELDQELKQRLKLKDGLFQFFYCQECCPYYDGDEPHDNCKIVPEADLGMEGFKVPSLQDLSAASIRNNNLVRKPTWGKGG